MSEEPRQNKGRGLVDRKLVEAPQWFHHWPTQGGTSVLSPLSCSFFVFSLARFIVVVSVVSICFIRDFSILATCPSMSAALFAFCCVLFVFLLFVVVLSGEPKQNQGQGLVDRKLVQAPQVVPRWFFWFGSLVILDVMCCYLLLFLLSIYI